MFPKALSVLNNDVIGPAAETGNSTFRSTQELEKVRHRIVLEQCLLSTAQYVVKWKSGIRSEINGCFSTSLALERENEATKYRTFPFTIVAPKSTDMSQILYHLKTCVTEVQVYDKKLCHVTDHVTGKPFRNLSKCQKSLFFFITKQKIQFWNFILFFFKTVLCATASLLCWRYVFLTD